MRKKQKDFLMITLLITVVLIGFWLLHSTEEILLKNANVMGKEIASQYSVHAESYISKYELLLKEGDVELQTLLDNGASDSEIESWLEHYLQRMQQMLDLGPIEMIACVEGKALVTVRWDGFAVYNPTTRGWYNEAMQAQGEVVYTNAYIDARNGNLVVTAAKQMEGSENALAVDIYPENLENIIKLENAPKGTRYYLCDGQGTLLQYKTSDSTGDTGKGEVQKLFEGIQSGVYQNTNINSVIDETGQERGVYYSVSNSGWYSIITIPTAELLAGTSDVRIIHYGMLALFLVVGLIFLIKEATTSKSAKLLNKIFTIMGNSCYALYLVDLKKESFEVLKTTENIKSIMQKKACGNYQDFVKAMEEVIDPRHYQDFADNLSLQHLHHLMESKTRNFGGDFKRWFQEGYRWVHADVMYDETISKNQVVISFKEIDETKQKELIRNQLVKDSLESMKEMAQMRNMFFSNVSHDMRTPLNAITGLSVLAQQHLNEPDVIKNYLEKIQISSNQLLGLVNDTLEMSKMEHGKVQLNIGEFVLEDSLKSAMSLFEIQADVQNKSFSIHTKLRHNLVKGDWFRIQQVLNNIVSNAFKFTQEGDRISVCVEEINPENNDYPKFRFEVTDTGAGMSQEFLGKIFLPFERETNFAASKVAGTGLGMAIAHSMVMQMEGEISVESELGKGSRFVITLPLQIAEKSSGVRSVNNASKESLLKGVRVLLAEDNEINMEISTELLRMRGLSVEQAWNGKEALSLFESSEPFAFDVILMDMQMPLMDGCEAAKAIRNLNRKDAKQIPIIAVTANAFAEDVAKTKQAGMNAHISKPIDFEALEKVIQKLLSETIAEEQVEF